MRTPALILLVALASPGCSHPVDLKQVLRVTDLTGGYHDAGIVEGRNKIVPSVTFRITKSTDDSLRPLSLNVVFKKLPSAAVKSAPGATVAPGEEDWDEVFLQSISFE